MKKKPNTASQAFRNAANAVQKSDHWLADYFRRMKAKGGNKYAVVATANKIATIYYKIVRYKQEFNPVVLEQYQQKYKKAKIAYLERKLNSLKQWLRLYRSITAAKYKKKYSINHHHHHLFSHLILQTLLCGVRA